MRESGSTGTAMCVPSRIAAPAEERVVCAASPSPVLLVAEEGARYQLRERGKRFFVTDRPGDQHQLTGQKNRQRDKARHSDARIDFLLFHTIAAIAVAMVRIMCSENTVA